jgi:hypothetical protein
MKYRKIILFLSCFLIFGCTSLNKIETDIISVESFRTRVVNNNCASIISNNFIIAVEELNKTDMENIRINNIFKNKNIKYRSSRIPKLIFLKILIENTENIPLDIGDIKLQYNNIFSNQLTAVDLRKRYNHPPYSVFNFDEILSLFKIDSDELCDTEIDFSEDLKKYQGSIMPGDKAFKIIAFDWIPVGIREFSLSIVIKSDIIKKIIDFKLMRSEYRHSGGHFLKPVIDDNAL